MFCPACGRENSTERRKFCATCGTNLEAVSEALSRSGGDDFFTKVDAGFDQFIIRYSERVFKIDPASSSDRGVAKSWKILGKGVLTSITDIFLFLLVWNILPLRFLILLISTPFRLLSERSKQRRRAAPVLSAERAAGLPPHEPQQWLSGPAASVTEHTTMIISDSQRREPNLKASDRNTGRV